MNILMKYDSVKDGEQLNIEEGMTIEDLIREKGPFKYDILLASLNGRDTELTEELKEGDSVELLDMRTQGANLTYQRSLNYIYIIAVKEIFAQLGVENADAEIDNSLNKGFFTRREIIVRFSKIQYAVMFEGIIEKRLGLASIDVLLAGSRQPPRRGWSLPHTVKPYIPWVSPSHRAKPW